MTEYQYRISLAGIKDIEELPNVPHDDGDLQKIISEARNLSIPLKERSNWAVAGESFGNLANSDFISKADAALSAQLGKSVKIGHHIPFVKFDVVDGKTGAAALSYTLPAGVFTSATIGEGAEARKILGPTFSVFFNTLGPMAAKREIPL